MTSAALSTTIYSHLWRAFSDEPAPQVLFTAPGALPSCYAVSDLAAACFALFGAMLARLSDNPAPAVVDRRLASFWFQHSHRPVNRPTPPQWDPFAGDYAAAEGWIRLHTNAPHHRQAMERVLGRHADRQTLAREVARWRPTSLEQAIVDAGGCAAALRTAGQWREHPQGAAVAGEPLLHESFTAATWPPEWPLTPARPLAGVRILDLTRIIAGPAATRALAGLGADVLRIDPPGWAEPTLEEEIGPGKRRAWLDLRAAADIGIFRDLLRQTDIIVHGYRADALTALGFPAAVRRRLAPGLIDVSLNAWGWRGPWRNRRGFDSLVQMACGIAAAGQQWRQADRPVPLPVQALDHATGYMMAAAALKGMAVRRTTGRGYQARLSLARTAAFLQQWPAAEAAPFAARKRGDQLAAMEWSAFGLGERLRFPLWLAGTPTIWSRPPVSPGADAPRWG